MPHIAYPAVFGILTWWFFTGVVLYLVWRQRQTRAVSMAIATVAQPFAFYVLWASSTAETAVAAYAGFSAALVIWAWHELSFLLGLITGPRTSLHVKQATARAALLPAIETVIYHEFAIALTAALIVALSWEAPNQCGTLTFVILWLMRLSTKINIYLGVPNVTEDFLPKHLTYLKSYFCRRAMNVLFPLSVTVSTIVTVLFAQAALAQSASDFDVASYGLLATFCALGLIEHWFLVLPLPAQELWSWSLSKTAAAHGAMRPDDPAIVQAALVPAPPLGAPAGTLLN